MRSIFVALALVAGVGCSQAQRELEDIEKRACSCTDAKCADFMINDLGAWGEKHKDDSVSDEDDLKRSLNNTVECIIKAGGDAMTLKTRLMSLGS
jgi:hypothetical protein